MNKKIIFDLDVNKAPFDAAVEEIQRKLKAMYAPVDMMRRQDQTGNRMNQMGMGGALSPASMEAFQKATQSSRREMDQLITEQARGQEKLSKLIVQRTELLKKLQAQQKAAVTDSKEELKIKETITRVEENQQRLRESYRQRDMALNQVMDARESLKPKGLEGLVQGYRGGGMSGAARAGMGMMGPGTIGSIIGMIGKIGESATEIYRDFSKSPARTEIAMGSAVQGTLGTQAANIYGRRSSFEQMFAPERARASQIALQQLQATQNADKAGMGFGLLKSAGAGMGMGAAAGSILPGVGTAVGAGVGGAIGLGKGLLDIMGDERKRSLAMSPFSQTASKRYQSILAEEVSKDYEATLEAQKRQNPFKTMAVNEYEQNFQRNLQSQRAMGLGNAGFYGKGGFMDKNISAGFTQEMGLEMSGNILGSGGSTRMARDSAFGNQLSRGMDLTNAGQVLGTLSGGIGGSEATKQATVKILAEGMKLGLDDSKFAEENRKFTQAAAEIVARSGAKGEGDFERVAGGFGKFMGENTTMGIGAAKTAYEQYQQISQSTTGPRGVMRAAGFLGDKDLSKISTMTKQALMQVPESDLNEDNPLVQAAAQEAGISAKEVVQKVSGVNQGSVSRFKEADQLRDKVRAYAKKIGKENLTEEDIKNAPKDVQADFNKMAAFQTTELGYQGQRETVARALGTVNTGASDQGAQKAREETIGKKTTGDTGRMEDSTVKAMAADSKVVLDNFNEMAPAMKKAAESTAAWTREVREMNAALTKALEDAKSGKGNNVLDTIKENLSRMQGPKTQDQAGKQSR